MENSHLKVITGGNQAEQYIQNYNKEVRILPRNITQDNLLATLEDTTKPIVFATGPAGTGKTMISTLYAIREFKKGNVDKIIITRPAVSVDKQHGFLPGTLQEKMAPWTRPIFDIFEEYFNLK